MNNFVIYSPVMKYWLFIFLSVVLISCKNQENNDETSQNAVDTTAMAEKIKISDKSIALEPKPRDFALEWVEFIAAQNEVERLKNVSVEEVINKSAAISQIMQSLQTSLPDSLKSVPVEARLNVVSTKAQLLDQYSHKRKPDPKLISQTTVELYDEFNNLKLQMNEIFRKTLEDFEKELDQFEEKEKDSLAEKPKNQLLKKAEKS